MKKPKELKSTAKEMKLTAKSLDVGLIFFIRLNFLVLHFQTGFCKPEFICKPKLIIFGSFNF
ncbi:unnamed protein product [Brassica oleracea var. botrytis]